MKYKFTIDSEVGGFRLVGKGSTFAQAVEHLATQCLDRANQRDEEAADLREQAQKLKA